MPLAAAGHAASASPEVLALDGRHRLVLIRRDGVEHLIILGPDAPAVVEANIAPPPASFAVALAEAGR